MIYSLTAPGVTFTHTHVQGGVAYTESVNAGEDITLGSCVAGQIEFSVLDLHYTEMVHYAGTEFDFSTHDLLPYGFAENDLLITQDGQRYYFPANQEFIGKFTVLRPERLDESKWKFVGMDRMARFDRVVDGWFAALTFPMTLKALLTSLCAHCGVELQTQTFPNQNFVVRRNITGSGIKGRDVLSWIAEVAASFARITPAGKLELAFYAPRSVTIDRTIRTRVSDYEVQKVDKLQVQATEDDIGVIVGTGSNAYIIQANPLLVTASDAELHPAAETIFNRLKGLPLYTPLEVETYTEHADGCRAGDIVQVSTSRGTYTTCITSRQVAGNKVTLTSVGAETRRQVLAANRWVQRIRGKTNEIIATVEELSVTLTDLDADTKAQLRVQADQISAEVSRASAAEGTLNSQITMQAGQISSKVSKTEYNGNTIASLINQTATTILIQASKINLVGYVTADALETGSIKIQSSNSSYEKVVIEDGSLNFYYGSYLRGRIYTNSNINQDLCISAASGRTIAFATGGTLRGRFLSDGTFDNQRYDFTTSGAYLLTQNAGSTSVNARMELDSSANLILRTVYSYGGKDIRLEAASGVVEVRDRSGYGTIKARLFQAENRAGWSGTFSTGGTSTRTVTVTGGIITNVS